MRKLTKISLITVSFISFITLSAHASILQVTEKALRNDTNMIHITIVHAGNKPIQTMISLNLGTGDENNCQITENLPPITKKLVSTVQVALDGDTLAQYMGLGYTCAEEIYAPEDLIAKIVRYSLQNDGNTYISATPNQQEITLAPK